MTSKVTIYRSPLSKIPLMLAFLGSLIAVVVFTVINPLGIVTITISDHTLDLSIFSLLAILFLVMILHYIYDAHYLIEEDCIRSVRGVLSLKKKDTRIDFINIKGIEIDANIYDRMFNLGRVRVGSSMNKDIEIIIDGIRNPEQVRDLIEEEMKKIQIPQEFMRAVA